MNDAEGIPFDRKRKNELMLVIDRLKVNPSIKHRLAEAIENAAEIGNKKIIIVREDRDVLFNLAFAVESTGKSYPEITPHTFAFNNAEGMCPECMGLGYQYGANLMQKPEVMQQSVASLVKVLWYGKYNPGAFDILDQFLDAEGIDPYTPLEKIPVKKLQLLMNGSPAEKWYKAKQGFKFRWVGINHILAKAGKSATPEIRESILPLLEELECLSCHGSRLNPLAQHVTIQDKSISDFCKLPLDHALPFIEKISLNGDNKLLDEVKTHLINRLKFLCEVGLTYISLDRRAPTLSGGEAQRIRLARQLGSGLTGVLYVLDEPTIGLHPRDNDRLNNALRQLQKLGNTMLMVEHDPLTIETADYILDFGPQSGAHGGHIVAKGTYKQILRNAKSLTGAYLSGKLSIPIPEQRRPINEEKLLIRKANENNLKNVTVEIPVGAMTCLTGVSGSGKSTLMQQVLLPAVTRGMWNGDVIQMNNGIVSGISNFDKVISIDQNPIGQTARSDVGTYVEVLTRIREFFATLPASRMRGLQPKHFSYNHRRGMCTIAGEWDIRRSKCIFLRPSKWSVKSAMA